MLQDKLRICVWYPEIDAQCDCGHDEAEQQHEVE